MELITHAKSISDYRKSVFFLLGCYLVLAIIILVYLITKNVPEIESFEMKQDIPFEMNDLPTTLEEFERFKAPPPPKAKKTEVIPKIVETDSIVETDTVIASRQDENNGNNTGISENGENENPDETDIEVIEAEELEKIYFVVDKMPEYPGGEISLRRFVAKNLKYPSTAYNNGIQGVVYVRFCITVSGKVDKITIVQGVNPLLDKEVLRIIQMLPQWSPGEQKGVKVPVWITLPINFKLN